MLGDAASRIRELDAYWGPASVSRASATDGEDWTRKVSFRYAPGTAPRVVTHQPHVADGDYTVEISIVADTDRMTIRRRVRLAGGVTSIDLASLGSSLPGGLP
jgi:hypothetical protein